MLAPAGSQALVFVRPRASSCFSARRCIPRAPCAESLCSLSFRSLGRTLQTQAGARRPITTANCALREVLQLHEGVPAHWWDRALIPRAGSLGEHGRRGQPPRSSGTRAAPLSLCRRRWAS